MYSHFFSAPTVASLAVSNLGSILMKGSKQLRTVGQWCMKEPKQETCYEIHNVVFELTNPLACMTTQHSLGAEIETEDYLLGLNPGYTHFGPWSFYDRWRDKTTGVYPYAYGSRGGVYLDDIIDLLKKDDTSRHAHIALRANHIDLRNDFVPCTLSWSFQVIDGKLDMTSVLRSQDACRGFFLDMFAYPVIQMVVASALGIPIGKYYHILLNSHVYESDLDLAQMIFDNVKHLKNIGRAELTDFDRYWMKSISQNIFVNHDFSYADSSINERLSHFWQLWKKNQLVWARTKYEYGEKTPVELTMAGPVVGRIEK